MKTIKCTVCKRLLETNKFYKSKNLNRGYGYKCRRCDSEYVRKWQKGIRIKVLVHYSNNNLKCACCGEKEYDFLCLDHINNDGGIERKKLGERGRGIKFYSYLIKNKFPEGLQVLCYNCNMGKGFNRDCPHKKLKVGGL